MLAQSGRSVSYSHPGPCWRKNLKKLEIIQYKEVGGSRIEEGVHAEEFLLASFLSAWCPSYSMT